MDMWGVGKVWTADQWRMRRTRNDWTPVDTRLTGVSTSIINRAHMTLTQFRLSFIARALRAVLDGNLTLSSLYSTPFLAHSVTAVAFYLFSLAQKLVLFRHPPQ